MVGMAYAAGGMRELSGYAAGGMRELSGYAAGGMGLCIRVI